MIGNLDSIVEKFDNDKEDFAVAGVSTSGWNKKQKYEENEIILDFRSADDDGTLDLAVKIDKTTNKFIPEVKMVSGCLVIKLRREK